MRSAERRMVLISETKIKTDVVATVRSFLRLSAPGFSFWTSPFFGVCFFCFLRRAALMVSAQCLGCNLRADPGDTSVTQRHWEDWGNLNPTGFEFYFSQQELGAFVPYHWGCTAQHIILTPLCWSFWRSAPGRSHTGAGFSFPLPPSEQTHKGCTLSPCPPHKRD